MIHINHRGDVRDKICIPIIWFIAHSAFIERVIDIINILTRVHEALNHQSDEAIKQMIKYNTFAENDMIRKGRSGDNSDETNQYMAQSTALSSSP